MAHLGVAPDVRDQLAQGVNERESVRFDEGRTSRVEQAIEAGLAGPLTIEHLARVVRLGPTHFKRVFRATFGTSVHAYVIRRRVERARELLANDAELSRAQVAGRTGFADQSHMARWLRWLS